MDWKLKYLKYKNKYLSLKKTYQIGGTPSTNLSITNSSSEYFDLLKKLYPNCVKNPNESKEQTHTYGEMEYEGVEMLYSKVKEINPNIKYFLDIGSGRGKLPCWFAGFDKIDKSTGIEIVEERCLDAEKLKSELSKQFPNQVEKINLLCGDFTSYDLSFLVDSNPDTLVWISNLCFGPELTTKLFTQILSQMVVGTICTCSVKPDNEDNLVNGKKLQFIKTTKIQMSWWDNLSDVHIYRIVQN
jgi:hypothetical protein